MASDITWSIIAGALASTTEEMGESLRRAAYSPIIREMLDFACAIFEPRGRLVATSPKTIPSLIAHMDPPVHTILDRFAPNDIHEGDVFVANDPYGGGGSHVPDLHIVKPVFADGRWVALAVTNAHHIDFGGPYPGGESIHSRSIFHEGLRIPTLKLVDRGRENEGILAVIACNVRDPRSTLGDIRAQMAACNTAESRISELAAKYGSDALRESMDRIMDYSERRLRATIAALPDGEVTFRDFFEGGASYDPVRLEVRLRVAGDSVLFDFTGTDDQVEGPVNLLYSATRSCAFTALAMFAHSDAPANDGSFRPMEIIAPCGSFVNARFPAAAGLRHISMVRLTDMLLHAFAHLYPDRSHAGAFAGFMNFTLGGTNPANGEMKVLEDTVSGALGAGRSADGLSAVDVNIGNLAMLSVEACEIEYPVRVQRCELVPDSGGPGRFRGGLGMRRDLEILEFEQSGTAYTEQAQPAFAAWGLIGGRPGAPPTLRIKRRDGSGESFTMKDYVARPGDALELCSGGGGGCGNPGERDPEAVARDLNYGYISLEHARRYYGWEPPDNP